MECKHNILTETGKETVICHSCDREFKIAGKGILGNEVKDCNKCKKWENAFFNLKANIKQCLEESEIEMKKIDWNTAEYIEERAEALGYKTVLSMLNTMEFRGLGVSKQTSESKEKEQ